METKVKKFIISRYKEDFNWVKDYTDNYIIYNKGEPVFESNVFNTENIGGNQRDIFHFISSNYDNLPDMMVFLQAFPFDHCKKEVFDKIISNDGFTPFEYYEDSAFGGWSKRDYDGGYMETNNSWYIRTINAYYNQGCRYSSFEQFMNKYFENYVRIDWIRFTPGSQYMIEKHQALQYPKLFWEALMNELDTRTPTEGHIIERALWLIFKGIYKPRKEFYE